ncbi:MAG: hypothetical protein AAB426_01040 [Myxococcota bacterium]
MNNVPHDITGLDDSVRRWMDKIVLVPDHPEWGEVRVLRWFPGTGDQPEQLRVLSPQLRAPKVVRVGDVRIVETTAKPVS